MTQLPHCALAELPSVSTPSAAPSAHASVSRLCIIPKSSNVQVVAKPSSCVSRLPPGADTNVTHARRVITVAALLLYDCTVSVVGDTTLFGSA